MMATSTSSSRKEKESFLEAAWRGDLGLVRELAAHAPDAADSKGRTAAHFAAARKDAATLGFLVRCGADADACDVRGVSPAHVAASAGRTEAMEVLERAGGDLSCGDERDDTPLHLAARRGRPRLADWLLLHGADGKATNTDGLTPLMELLLRCVDFEELPTRKQKAAERGRQCIRNWFGTDVGRQLEMSDDSDDVLDYGDEELEEEEDVLRCEEDATAMADRLASAAGPAGDWKVNGHEALALAEALGRARAVRWIRRHRSTDSSTDVQERGRANGKEIPNGSAAAPTPPALEEPAPTSTDEAGAWTRDAVSDAQALRAERALRAAVKQLHEDQAFQQAMRREDVRQAVAEVADDPRCILRWSHHPDAMVALHKLRQLQELRRRSGARKVALEELLVSPGQEDVTRQADARAAKELRRALRQAKRTADAPHDPSEIQPAPQQEPMEVEAKGLTWRQVFRTTLLQLLCFVLFLWIATAVQRRQNPSTHAAEDKEL